VGVFRKKQPTTTTDVEELASEMAVVSAVVAQYPSREATVHFGAPTRCPRCANFGFVDDVDRQSGTCENSCMSCGESWTLTRRAIKAERAMRSESADLHESLNPEVPTWMSGADTPPEDDPVVSGPSPDTTTAAKVGSVHEPEPEAYVPRSQRPADPRLPKFARGEAPAPEPLSATDQQLPREARFEATRPEGSAREATPTGESEAAPRLEDLVRRRPGASNPGPSAQQNVRHPPTAAPEPPVATAPPDTGTGASETTPTRRPTIDWSGSSTPSTRTESVPDPPQPASTTPYAPEESSPLPSRSAAPTPSPPPLPSRGVVDVEPGSDSPASMKAEDTGSAAAVGGPLRVLVVEDNVFDFMALETLVDELPGLQIEFVHATTLLEGYRLVDQGFDLTLLDLGLPDSAGISTVLEWQHNTDSDIPIIVISGDATPELVQQARGLGVAHFLKKEHLEALAENPEAGAVRLLKLLRATVLHSGAPSGRSVPSP